MRNFLNNYILRHFGWTIWQLLTMEDDRHYFSNWLIVRSNKIVSPLLSQDWDSSEVWIDPMHSPPYVLLLMCVGTGSCSIFDPAQGYEIVKEFASYREARLWLIEDEYEVVDSRLVVL
jgi:hypothetical protein